MVGSFELPTLGEIVDLKYIILMIIVGIIFAIGSACVGEINYYHPESVDSTVEV
jgi:hypothetical protein